MTYCFSDMITMSSVGVLNQIKVPDELITQWSGHYNAGDEVVVLLIINIGLINEFTS